MKAIANELEHYVAMRKLASDAHAKCVMLRHELAAAEQAHKEARTRAFAARAVLNTALDADDSGYSI